MTIVEEMRRAFDQAFTKPDPPPRARPVRLFAVRAGDRLLIIRANEVAQIVRTPALASVPGSGAAFLGLGAVRGMIVAFYSLAALVSGGSAGEGAWAALCGRKGDVGLVFDEMVGSLDTPSDEQSEMFELDGRKYASIDVHRIIAEIEPRGE